MKEPLMKYTKVFLIAIMERALEYMQQYNGRTVAECIEMAERDYNI